MQSLKRSLPTTLASVGCLAMLLSSGVATAQSSLLGPPTPPVPPVPQPINPLTQAPPVAKPKAPPLPLIGKFREHEVLVKFQNAVFPTALLQSLNLNRAVGVGGAGWHRLVSNSLTTEALVTALQIRGDVIRVEPNYLLQAASSPCSGTGSVSPPPSDPCYTDGSLWGLGKIAVASVWNSIGTTGSSSIVVGMLDSGIRATHEDLSDNMWLSPSFSVCVGTDTRPCPSANTVTCSVGTRGFNAVAFGGGGGTVCDPSDDTSTGHGTLTAGVVGAKGNNSPTPLGVVGVNWVASLMALKIADSSQVFAASDAMNGIDFAIQMNSNYGTNIRVLNGSFGCRPGIDGSSICTGATGDFTSLQEEIQKAARSNMLFVASAGNNGLSLDCGSSSCQLVPAYWSNPSQLTPNIISVAATDVNDNLTSYSNYGSASVQLAAPGGTNSVPIWSTFNFSDSYYLSDSGTSFSAPYVSGTAALMIANSDCAANTLPLKSAIITNVDGLSLNVSSGGRLNAYRAIRGCALQNMAVSPGSGSSSSTTFSYTFHDMLGYADLDVVDVLINDFLDGRNACYIAYSWTSNLLYLVGDNGSTLGTGYTPGTSQTLSNTQCSIDVGSSGTSNSGNELTLNVATTFASGFAGTRIIYAAGRDVAGNNSGWQPVGTWAVPTLSTASPYVASWSPTTSSSLNQTFSAVTTDTAGYANISTVDSLINGDLNGINACYIAYSQSADQLYLVNDAGTGTLSPGLTPGGSGSVSNTQCQINALGSSTSKSGNNLTVNVSVTFFAGFQKAAVAYVSVLNSTGGNSGWQRMGAWN